MRLRMDKELIRLILQHGVPKKKLSCGITHLDKETFLEYIDNLRETYRADAYHLLSFNCKSCRLPDNPHIHLRALHTPRQHFHERRPRLPERLVDPSV